MIIDSLVAFITKTMDTKWKYILRKVKKNGFIENENPFNQIMLISLLMSLISLK